MMTSIRILTPTILAAALVSCATDKGNQYDTANPYGAADPSMAANPAAAPNPVYDSPAAYGDTGGYTDASAITPAPGIPPVPPLSEPAYDPTPAPGPNAPATIHTVVAGDTLSGLSSKYKIPMDSIKRANNMTNDTVILGRKMVIPPR